MGHESVSRGRGATGSCLSLIKGKREGEPMREASADNTHISISVLPVVDVTETHCNEVSLIIRPA